MRRGGAAADDHRSADCALAALGLFTGRGLQRAWARAPSSSRCCGRSTSTRSGEDIHAAMPRRSVLSVHRAHPPVPTLDGLQVEHVVGEVTIPPHVTPEKVTTHIIDSSGALPPCGGHGGARLLMSVNARGEPGHLQPCPRTAKSSTARSGAPTWSASCTLPWTRRPLSV